MIVRTGEDEVEHDNLDLMVGDLVLADRWDGEGIEFVVVLECFGMTADGSARRYRIKPYLEREPIPGGGEANG